MIKGLYHCHSKYSYDGVKTLDEILLWLKINNFNFIILTEHNDDFSHEKFKKFYNECVEKSSDIILIPGIEYEFIVNNKIVHVGVIGINKYYDLHKGKISLEDFLDDVRKSGGLSILHHPYRIIDGIDKSVLRKFDFIEMWNVVHDIRYSPNSEIVKKSMSKGFDGSYLASSDIHKYKNGDINPYLEFYENENKSIDECIKNIKIKKYKIINKKTIIEQDGTINYKNYIYAIENNISGLHQKIYENIRLIYNKYFKHKPPKWAVRLLK